MNRALYALLILVAGSAVVLSWSAQKSLAEYCGFTPALASLLPLVVDCGAAAGSIVWLGNTAPAEARRYARLLTLTLLVASVGFNGVSHYLHAYGLRPPWWLVVAVSAVAPAVLATVIHLAVLLGRSSASQSAAGGGKPPGPPPAAPTTAPQKPARKAKQSGKKERTPEQKAAAAARSAAYRERQRLEKQFAGVK